MNSDTNLSPEELLEFKQVMKDIEEAKNNPLPLPDDVSLEFAMSADNLYAIWSTPTENMKLIDPTSEMQLNWILASEDTNKAFTEISAQHDDNKLLAFIKFSDLRDIVQQISLDTIWQKISKSFNHLYFVQRNGQKYWTQTKEGEVLLKGKLSDIEALYQEGNTILETKDYVEVFDARPVELGHPKDWIRFMRDPSSALTVRECLMEQLGYDGSK